MSFVYLAATAERAANMAKFTVFALAAVAAIAPVAFLDQIPFADAPNHLARFHIMHSVARDPHLAEYYYVKDGFYPYFGMRFVIGVLTPALGTERAAHVFALLALLMPALGATVLARAIHGRTPAMAATAFAFSMNMLAGWGFLNYLFSLGAVLLVFAAWIGTTRWPLAWRVPAFWPPVLIVGCVHLVAAPLLVALIFLYELCSEQEFPSSADRLWRVVRRLSAVAALALPLLALSAVVSGEEIGSSQTVFSWIHRLDALASPFVLGLDSGWTTRAVGLAMAAALYMAVRERVLIVKPPFGRVLLLLIVAAAFAPAAVSGVYGMHLRLPLLIVLVLVAASEIDVSRVHFRLVRLLGAAAAVATAGHLISSGLVLRDQDRRITELRRASVAVPQGARIIPAIDLDAGVGPGQAASKALFHVASYFVIDRSAFLPTLFGMYEIGARPPYRPIFPSQATPVSYKELLAGRDEDGEPLPAWADVSRYNYLIVFNQRPDRPGPTGAALVHVGSYFKIWRLR